MASAGIQARAKRSRKRASPARSEATRLRHKRGRDGVRAFVPKVPRVIQQSVNQLIEKAQSQGLTRREQRLLDEVLDYLADLTIRELERIRDARRPRPAV